MSDVIPSAPFWMVYGIDQGAATVRHASADDARREARRLARAHPGIVFVVMASIEATVKNELVTRSYRGKGLSDDDIPF